VHPETMSRVLQALGDASGGLTVGGLAAASGLSYGAAQRAVAEADRRGWLRPVNAIQRIGQQRRWALSEAGWRQLNGMAATQAYWR